MCVEEGCVIFGGGPLGAVLFENSFVSEGGGAEQCSVEDDIDFSILMFVFV